MLSWLNLFLYMIALGVITWVFFIIDRLGRALTQLDKLSSYLEDSANASANPLLLD